jgi:hypothetical protein
LIEVRLHPPRRIAATIFCGGSDPASFQGNFGIPVPENERRGQRGDCEARGARGSLCDIMSHAQRLAALLGQLRGAFRREELPPPSEERPAASRRSVLGLLFALEPLPRDPPPPPARRSLVAAVFAPEALPLDAEAPARKRARWLTWLLAPEPLDGESTGPEVH